MKKYFAVLLVFVMLFAAGCGGEQESAVYGSVKFFVVDGLSGMPIENVRIVLPESGNELYTDSDGKTETINLGVSEKGGLACECGTFTVLAYKDEYNDFALFYAQIDKEKERTLKLYMFMKDTPMGNGAPISTVESPEKDRVSEIVEKYRK